MSAGVPLPTGLFWHIFRKDWRQLKPLVIANAALQSLQALVTFHSQPYRLSEGISGLGALVTLGLLITLTLLIVLSVQQERLPGANQDWLVRPIRRGDLLLAKLLGLAVFVHGPIIVVNVLVGLAEGFSLGPMVWLTLLGNLEIALLFSLPAMAVAAVTRSVGEAVIVSLAALIGLIAARVLIAALLMPFTHGFHFSGPVSGTGIEWVWRFASHVVLLGAVVAALGAQYFSRNTLRSRVILVGGLFLYMCVLGLPWSAAFAIQQRLSADPEVGRAVVMAFDPTLSREAGAAGAADRSLVEGDAGESKDGTSGDGDGSGGGDARRGGDRKGAGAGRRVAKKVTRLILPMQISGMPAGRTLHTDRCEFRLVAGGGRTLYRGLCEPVDVPSSLVSDGRALLHQSFEIPAAVETAAVRPVRVELEYSLTLLRSRALPALAALDAEQRLPEVGRCATRIDSSGTAIEVGCRQVGEVPPCLSIALEQGGRGNTEQFVCEPNYEPAAFRFDVDPIDAVHAKLPFRDPQGVGHFPVGEAALREARVVFRVYEAEAHFSRRLVIPQLALSDWRAASVAR